jgi:hypothetical protein
MRENNLTGLANWAKLLLQQIFLANSFSRPPHSAAVAQTVVFIHQYYLKGHPHSKKGFKVFTKEFETSFLSPFTSLPFLPLPNPNF